MCPTELGVRLKNINNIYIKYIDVQISTSNLLWEVLCRGVHKVQIGSGGGVISCLGLLGDSKKSKNMK